MHSLQKLRVLNTNGLKFLAAALMVVDHIGMLFFPTQKVWRIIGRLSMPLFAFALSKASCGFGTGVTTTSLPAMIISTYLSSPAQPHIAPTHSTNIKIRPTARRTNTAYEVVHLLCLQRVMKSRSE